MIHARDAVVEDVTQIAVQATRKLTSERVGVGHPDAVARRDRMQRDAVEPYAFVGLSPEEALARHAHGGHRVDKRARHDEARARRGAGDRRKRDEIEMVVVLVRADDDVHADRIVGIERGLRHPLGHPREEWVEKQHEPARTDGKARLPKPPERDRARREVEFTQRCRRARDGARHFAAAVVRAAWWAAMSRRYHSPLAFTRRRCVR